MWTVKPRARYLSGTLPGMEWKVYLHDATRDIAIIAFGASLPAAYRAWLGDFEQQWDSMRIGCASVIYVSQS